MKEGIKTLQSQPYTPRIVRSHGGILRAIYLRISAFNDRRGHVEELWIDGPVEDTLLYLREATLRKDFRQQPRQEVSGHNNKWRVKQVVLVNDDLGAIVADDLGICVADDLEIVFLVLVLGGVWEFGVAVLSC
jgi:hypothetical protein